MRNPQQNNNNRNRNRGRGGGRNGQPGGGGGGFRPDNRNNDRQRGNASQLLEKYKNLARDAGSAGDRVLAEYYMQHAEHYFRVLAEFRQRYEEQQSHQQRHDQSNGDDRESDRRSNDDLRAEGVSTMTIDQPAGFGAAAAVATFGADGPPQTEPLSSHNAPQASDNGHLDQEDAMGRGEEDNISAERIDAVSAESDAPPSTPRRRGRPRRQPMAEPVDA